MNAELDKQLCDKYPKIFAQRNWSEQETAMCWGFECGDGWYWLIDTMCEHIQRYTDLNKHLNIPQTVAVQVKEKFGTLSFYYDGGNATIGGIISHAEWLSGFICEQCGTKEDVSRNRTGWIKTLCSKCRNQKENGTV